MRSRSCSLRVGRNRKRRLHKMARLRGRERQLPEHPAQADQGRQELQAGQAVVVEVDLALHLRR